LIPASDGGDDLVRIGGPDEGPGIVIGLGEEALDGGLEIDEGSKGAALQSSLGQLGEEALDGIEPGGRFGRVMEHEAGMAIESGPHLGVLVAAVIVDDDAVPRASGVHPFPQRDRSRDPNRQARGRPPLEHFLPIARLGS
jgi:hypothetical protein